MKTTEEMDKLEPYQYHPLPFDSEGGISIRLVEFHAPEVTTGHPPPCSISTHFLSSSQQYEAISYFWGDPSIAPGQIVCDGKTISVPSNLYTFLSRMGLKSKGRKFWIDSICINQSDDYEKSSQVAEMRIIYAKARLTIVWLGPEGDDSALALTFAGKCSEALSDLDPKTATKRSLIYRARRYNDFSIFSKSWLAFFRLLDRAWFLRAWIVQEIALSTDTRVMVGILRVLIPLSSIFEDDSRPKPSTRVRLSTLVSSLRSFYFPD
ncbi:hypothetical protein VTL71DRAFT_14761 [Oculimacula yallundae]|uniref:Heterokaryon incompatibility domain-containing protein n=1 Tax=Oculimacula yallundae TaxID=86028 RepID=A0ABR4CLI2_9HELO